jgi:hypothetical protein
MVVGCPDDGNGGNGGNNNGPDTVDKEYQGEYRSSQIDSIRYDINGKTVKQLRMTINNDVISWPVEEELQARSDSNKIYVQKSGKELEYFEFENDTTFKYLDGFINQYPNQSEIRGWRFVKQQ